MARPSISLACIMKNEAHNITPLLQSVKGCFDEIIMVDTGSTDNSVEFIEKINEKIEAGDPDWAGIPKIRLGHFHWVNDFSKARQFAFDMATKEYTMWIDLDDCLSDATAFIKWRDSVMHAAHYWVATYNYSYNAQGKVECQFIRERVIKNNHGFKWEYFVHEGIVQKEGQNYWPQRVTTWTVNHRRTDEDRKSDHMRNLKLMEMHDLDKLHPRMKFYHGKELVENGFPEKACQPLLDAVKSKELDIHDRILAIQYAAQSAFACKAHSQAIDLLMNGLRLMPSRAEYWCLIGDIQIATNEVSNALISYKNALNCRPNDMGGVVVCHGYAYDEYPHQKIAEIYLTAGDIEGAKSSIDWLTKMGHPRAAEFSAATIRIRDMNIIRDDLQKSEDIVITCPPGGAVTDWDENTLETIGHGGSETAAIEVARLLREKTGRKVRVYQQRQGRAVMKSGVEYLPVAELAGYLQNIEPKAHISWRHAVRLTKAPSYVWCHDLQCQGAEKAENYDKIVALSEFHKRYLIETNGVREDKIALGFNGINPKDFPDEKPVKDPLKVVFSSSPDRGLIQTIDIVKKARELSGLDIKLHTFYGFENMRKAGQGEWADRIEKHITDNPFVTMHGQVSKKVLMGHFRDAGCWVYPVDFIESYCITAIESLCAGTWGIVRSMGALPFTLSRAIADGMVDMLDVEAKDEASITVWAKALVEAIEQKKWERVHVNPEEYSWKNVAEFFVKEMSL